MKNIRSGRFDLFSEATKLAQRSMLVFATCQGAFHALRPEDLQRRPDFFVGVVA